MYTRKFFIPALGASSKDISRYGDLIRPLGVRSFPSYHAAPEVCYPYGVFGWKPVGFQELAGYLVKHFNFNEDTCPKEPTGTFIERQHRKVTNMVELVSVTKKLGLRTQVVSLEKLTVLEQYATIRCTDVLVGVQGAGLQWAMFMRRKRALIELCFPGWGPLFSNDLRNCNGLVTKTVSGMKDGAQWGFVEKYLKKNKPFTEEEKRQFGSAKFMDSKYRPADFEKTLREVLQTLKLKPLPV